MLFECLVLDSLDEVSHVSSSCTTARATARIAACPTRALEQMPVQLEKERASSMKGCAETLALMSEAVR